MSRYLNRFTLLAFVVVLSSCVGGQLGKVTSQPEKGMVVSAYPDASKVGLEILKKGGNAVDAAVAVQFALAVVYPNAGNIGGGGFMVYRSAKGEIAALDFREKAPGLASRDMFLDSAGNPIKDKSLFGHLACGVPGSVAGMAEAHRKFGRLSWQQVLEPAISLAENGFIITEKEADDLNRHSQEFAKYNPAGTVFVSNGGWKQGDRLVQKDLAETLKRIGELGAAGFYEGETADKIVAEMQHGGGLISKEDLKNYHAVWRTPITGIYKGYKIITMPPTSSGGIALLQLLHSVENYPVARYGFNSDSTIQLLTEAERRVYADRATYLGDPDFFKVPQRELLEHGYSVARMKSMSFSKATPSSEIKAGDITVKESNQTTHFSIVDQYGNAVSITTTLNGSFGSKVVVQGAGFFLNNEMDDFSVKPGSPNMYGLVGGEANAIAPGKRMLSSMTPTIIEKDGKLFMVVGTPGGSTIMTSVFQTILNVIEFNKSMQAAVSAKRVHHQWLPDTIYSETGALDSLTKIKLQQKGYPIKEWGASGRVDAILKTKWGYYQGGADPRGDDTAMGW
ncbi:gamma-glutamyltransferase [Pedobacter sp. HMF7647]|uniref:Glutathione hydrolase proenzyme n=1 Tax=Hufsiella arboris TaxID=2695275 RepID=A0A7K1Y8Q8_9SPHI|nr:gamma-glutamyltransferase [Hufsiella arboris]MXV50965.1 gamma-glutamyltransferase [Hufsiella arboris]